MRQISFSFDELQGADIYNIVFLPSKGVSSFNQTLTHYSVNNLTPGQEYSITITAFQRGEATGQILRQITTGKTKPGVLHFLNQWITLNFFTSCRRSLKLHSNYWASRQLVQSKPCDFLAFDWPMYHRFADVQMCHLSSTRPCFSFHSDSIIQ